MAHDHSNPGGNLTLLSQSAGSLGGGAHHEPVTRAPAPFLAGFAFAAPDSKPTEHEWLSAKRLEIGWDMRNPLGPGAGVDLSSHLTGVHNA